MKLIPLLLVYWDDRNIRDQLFQFIINKKSIKRDLNV